MRSSVKHFVQWVGGSYYTIESFIQEGKEIGVMRRVPYIPDFTPLQTRIYLIHDVTEMVPGAVERIEHKKPVEELKKFRSFRVYQRIHPVVFGYFVPVGIVFFDASRIDVLDVLGRRYRVVFSQNIDFYIQKSSRIMIPAVVIQDVKERKESLEIFKRGCGLPRGREGKGKELGGIYLASFTAFYRALAFAKSISFEEAREKLMKELGLVEPPPDIVELRKWVRVKYQRIRALKEISDETVKRIDELGNK
jgi:hypothetical protein